ncbi:hypothetical protein L202_05481 [Cryptococcus amylolentus CBS 6039]|uniref:Uncharacterized protein n=2 Tax=Cryptococcus amylolentus TaxID=104669 RepID=A0A1E3HKM7_9TREE|nr:hypothetical protein L202_05481 [Cryptococcus amylolentus CBS 6039]ODN76903.1 hypothetical protein L202_05481 [Cryptococcus amylolentus CBS 6039]
MASSHPPTPPDTPPTLPLYTKVANVSPKVVNTSPTQTVPKQPSFPREAIPPKPLDMPITPMGSMNGPSSKKHSNLPGPILASPLPPKSEPPNRTLIRQDTIFVYPRKGIELILCLADRQEEICVSSHGKRLSIRSLKEGAATAPKQIILEHSSKWGKGERREWERVRKLVEVYKRQTPQAKLYHALGNITVTCSSPPDIILSFQLTPLRTPASRAAVADARVRVTYSRIARELRVDTSSIKPSKTGQGTKGSYEKLRTKRILSLRSDGTVDSMEKKGSTKDWRPEEMEGLKRLWNSMEAWNRWEGAGSGPG